MYCLYLLNDTPVVISPIILHLKPTLVTFWYLHVQKKNYS